MTVKRFEIATFGSGKPLGAKTTGKTMIKYRFAIDNNDKIVDINSLDKNSLTKEDKFFSVDFRQELIPRLGKERTRHFAHKSATEHIGSKETYLHSLGKKIFFDDYTECLRNKTPYLLKYRTHRVCTKLQDKFKIKCKLQDETSTFDLTSRFTEIVIERRDNNFIPDILLVTADKKEKIYIEIAVTHFSTETKKHSGQRIIEFIIESEEDVQNIPKFKTGEENDKIKFYGFKFRTSLGSFCGNNCSNHDFNFFVVSENGKCNLRVVSENVLHGLINKYSSTNIWYIYEPILKVDNDPQYHSSTRNGRAFRKYIKKAYLQKANVRNCFVCRYHAINNSWEYTNGQPIFCKFLKKTCNSNYAAECQYFKADINALD